jgi:hypothetical protein
MTEVAKYPREMVNSAKRREEFFNELGCTMTIHLLINRRFETNPGTKAYIVRKDIGTPAIRSDRPRNRRVYGILAACAADRSYGESYSQRTSISFLVENMIVRYGGHV